MLSGGRKSSIPTTLVSCPVCHAEIDRRCFMANGERTSTSHAARKHKYQEWIKQRRGR